MLEAPLACGTIHLLARVEPTVVVGSPGGSFRGAIVKTEGNLYCTQCGYGHRISKAEVEAGDYTEKVACSFCGTGLIRFSWEGDETG